MAMLFECFFEMKCRKNVPRTAKKNAPEIGGVF